MTPSAYDLLAPPGSAKSVDSAYAAKMLHQLDAWPIVVRETALLAFAFGKAVLDVGASGPMHAALKDAARVCYGLDAAPADGVVAFDLDDVTQASLPAFDGVERVVCGEVLEHLTNPGHFLRRLRAQYPVGLIISVPNAFTSQGARWIDDGQECVNGEHVAYYSQTTLVELLRRTGWRVVSGAWYKGRQGRSEGLLVIAEVADG